MFTPFIHNTKNPGIFTTTNSSSFWKPYNLHYNLYKPEKDTELKIISEKKPEIIINEKIETRLIELEKNIENIINENIETRLIELEKNIEIIINEKIETRLIELEKNIENIIIEKIETRLELEKEKIETRLLELEKKKNFYADDYKTWTEKKSCSSPKENECVNKYENNHEDWNEV